MGKRKVVSVMSKGRRGLILVAAWNGDMLRMRHVVTQSAQKRYNMSLLQIFTRASQMGWWVFSMMLLDWEL